MSPAVRRWGPWALLLVVAAVGLGFGLQPKGGAPSLDSRVQHISSQVRCPVCNGETVAESQAAPSVAIRNQIRTDLQHGETQAQILGSLVDSYGPGILEKPQASGIGVLVWVLPVIAVVIGAAGLALVVVRWRAKGQPAEAVVDGAEDAATVGSPVAAVPVAPAGGVEAAAGARTAATAVSTDGGVRAAAVVDPVGEPSAAGPTLSPAPAPDTVLARAIPAAPGRRSRRKQGVIIGAGAAVVAAGISWAVVASSGTRLPGQAITGQALGSEQITGDLQAALDAEARNDLVTALKDYQKILDAQPDQVQALTGKGWVLAQTGEPALLQQGITLLTSAEKTNPDYAPAHIYRGLALLGEGNYSDSIPDLQWYLAHNPDPQLKPQVEKALAEAQKAAAVPPPTSPAGSAAGG